MRKRQSEENKRTNIKDAERLKRFERQNEREWKEKAEEQKNECRQDEGGKSFLRFLLNFDRFVKQTRRTCHCSYIEKSKLVSFKVTASACGEAVFNFCLLKKN